MPNDITEAAYPNVEAWKDISANPNITVFYPETTTTQYEAAKYYLEDVINNGGYELYPNFSELFKPTNKHSSESIWEVEYKTGQVEGLGSPFYTLFSPASYAPRNKANSNGYIPSPISNQGNGACAPTGYFMDMAKKWDSMYPDYQYEVRKFDDVVYTDTRISNGNIKLDTDGISYLPVNENKDYTQNVAYPYDPYTGTSFRTSVKGFSADDQWMCGKYMGSSEYKVNDSDDNWYILRFADVLLLLAEAEAHINDGVLSQSILNNTINLVRERAGIVPYLASGDSNKEWVLDTPEKVYQAIYDERTLELAFEGHRWFDLVRSGKAVEVMNQHFTDFYNAYTSNSSPNMNNYYMKSESLGAARDKYELTGYPYLNIGSEDFQTNSGTGSEYTSNSVFGRVIYSYADRYLFQANVRHDGSSRFAKGYRWGTFPSVSAGWRISGEKFMQPLQDIVTDLKLRAGWGMNGNQGGFGNYAYMASMSVSKLPVSEGNLYPGLAIKPGSAANKELTWEKTSQWNLGLDLTMFDSRLSFSVDAYYKKTTDLLLTVSLPENVVPSSVTRNDGEMVNKGMEFTLSSQNFKGNFQWNTCLLYTSPSPRDS